MKARLKFLLMMTVLPLFLYSCSKKSQEKDNESDTTETENTIFEIKALSYDYPVKPGTDSWAALSSREARV